ncbi:ATP-binding cassette domain-containing protein [Jatrophihabitans endophyticus]|uniref:ATP-binding cassette domain-containing protein n=1 Tax=Jatrophihabitans endophyticus TaxID=1206085 RepID=UPI0019F5EE70|nr:ATP-binding cassette domain-containing protein [Jatrophihabitans endophyticus]MBE7187865.1 ATP-binding cassette domain-containing protein [Jatrophihabitans endophyticus]
MIEAQQLSKHYGSKVAVDEVSFTVRPGLVTGFLGPNGAGKSTTMRMILGLDRPSAGRVTVNGRPYAEHRDPLRQVGALLEARAVHPGRTARNHLLAVAATARIGRRRVDEVLDVVGLSDVADRRVGKFSLGMGQRLGIATALLGDPHTLILDEPVNGLDPEGVRWVRLLLRRLAGEGRTVFLSSHLMSEMAVTADHVIVVGKGRLLRDQPMAEFIAHSGAGVIRVRSPQAGDVATALRGERANVRELDAGVLEVEGITMERVGELAARDGLTLHELSRQEASLEEAYMTLTGDSVDYRSREDDRPAAGVAS